MTLLQAARSKNQCTVACEPQAGAAADEEVPACSKPKSRSLAKSKTLRFCERAADGIAELSFTGEDYNTSYIPNNHMQLIDVQRAISAWCISCDDRAHARDSKMAVDATYVHVLSPLHRRWRPDSASS
jgi:hypothetical protein